MGLKDPPLSLLPASQVIAIGTDSRAVNLYRSAASVLSSDADLTLYKLLKIGDGTADLANVLVNISTTSTGSMGMRFLIAGTEQWRHYMAGGNDKHLYVRDAANSRMQVTYTQGASASAALTQFGSAVTVDDALNVTGQVNANAGLAVTGTVTGSGFTKSLVGLGNVDNTSDATKNSATATLTNKTLTSPVINSPTGIVKADVGLGNVDNTSDINKPVSTAQQAAINAATAGGDTVTMSIMGAY